MSGATVDDLHLWVEKMMKSLAITDYKLDIGGNTTKGDGYVGEVTFLTVVTKKNDVTENYDVVIKSAKKSEELRKQTPVKEAYDREIFFYNKLFPILDEFQNQCGVERPFASVVKCYSIFEEDTKEALILENLKPLGYDLHDRKKPMNLNHVLLVCRQYGKFHALSMALKHKNPAVFKSLTKNMTDLFGEFIVRGQMIDVFYKEFDHLKKVLEEDQRIDILKKYDSFEKEFEKVLINYTNEDTMPSVLVHGDCWNNNFMFKYEGSDRTNPTDLRFLDFQITRVASPIMDLSYFLYCCADEKILKDLDTILQEYHSSLAGFLRELDCDAESLFPFKKLKEQWKDYGRYGLILSLFILKISLCDSNEAPDLIETAEKGENFSDNFIIKIKNQDVYNERIKGTFIQFAENFL